MAGHVRRNRDKCFIDIHWKGVRHKIYSDKDGNPLYSERQAARLLERIRSEIDTGEFNPKNYVKRELKALQLGSYALTWLERQEERLEVGEISHGYMRELRSAIKNYLIPKLGTRDIRTLNKGHIDDFLRLIKAAPKTKRNIMGVLKSILLDAVDRQDLLRLNFKFPKFEKRETRIKILTPEAQDEILEQFKDPVQKAFFHFLIYMGCRPGEARALRWEDIDWENKTVAIHAAMDLECYRPSTKEGDFRNLPLDEDVIASIEALPRTVPYIFTFNGKPFTQTSIGRWWRKAVAAAGYDVPLYQATKHSFGCQARARGVPLDVIQEWFGHKKAESTHLYAKLQVEAKKVMHRPQTVRSLEMAREKSNNKK